MVPVLLLNYYFDSGFLSCLGCDPLPCCLVFTGPSAGPGTVISAVLTQLSAMGLRPVAEGTALPVLYLTYAHGLHSLREQP